MPEFITDGALMQCDKGVAPSKLTVTSQQGCLIAGKPQATEKDKQAGANIAPFGVCSVTQKSCMPQPTAWQKTGPYTIDGVKELTTDSFCMCGLGGKMQFLQSGNSGFVKLKYAAGAGEHGPMAGLREDDDDPIAKLTEKTDLLIFIQDVKGEIDTEKMDDESEDWDYIVVADMQEAENTLRTKYKNKIGFIKNLVIKSHGHVSEGPDLDTKEKQGVVHNPANDKSLMYIRSLLTNSANVCFTACSIIQQYNEPKREKYSLARETANNYSTFFLKGTQRNLFMNYTASSSWDFENLDNSKVEEGKDKGKGSFTKGDTYWFLFDSPLVGEKSQWAGFMWFYPSADGKFLHQKYYYQIIVNSSGGLSVSKIRAIDPNNISPNNPKPVKKAL